MLELFEPLMWMGALWTFGMLTGLGIGVAIGRDQTDRKWHRELFEEDQA